MKCQNILDLGDTIDALATGIGKLADSIEKWALFGNRVISSVSARRAHARLKGYLVRGLDIFMSQTGALDTLEACLMGLKDMPDASTHNP